jgi:hypothetical protein
MAAFGPGGCRAFGSVALLPTDNSAGSFLADTGGEGGRRLSPCGRSFCTGLSRPISREVRLASLTQVRCAADVFGVMRRKGAALIALQLVCASAMLGAGCGSGVSKSHSLSAGAQAVAVASAINLRQPDVPGLAGQFERDRKARSGPLGHCDEASASGLVGFQSQRFGRGGTRVFPTESVSSGVYLMASEAQAVREFDALDSARARACIRRGLEAGTIENERGGREPFATHYAVLPLEPLLRPLPVRGIRRIERAAIPAPGDGRSEVYLDQSGFTVGRVLVTLLALGSHRSFPLATERRLLALLYSRAEAHRIS